MLKQLSFIFLCVGSTLFESFADSTYKQHSYGGDNVIKNVQSSIADSISDFTIDLIVELQRASQKAGNVVCSPINVYGALAILLLGASGSTWDEIKGAMKLPNNNQFNTQNMIHSEISNFLKLIQEKNIRIGNKTVSQVIVANGIFVEKQQRINQNYHNVIEQLYNGYISKLNFGDGSAAADQINKWVALKTNGQISKIFFEPLDRQTSIVQVTTVYFSGGWNERFPLHMTKKEAFATDGRAIEVDMMNNKGRIPYHLNTAKKFESIQLDFYGRYYSAIFILPHEDQPMSSLVSSLTGDDLEQIFNQTTYRGVHYKIPRMKIFASKSLKGTLRSLGVRKVFEEADLSQMLDSAAHRVADVAHAVEIEVDESGAKATAVTSVRIEPLSAKSPPEDAINFFLNRPFITLIRHRTSGIVLFAAVVKEPI